MRKKTESKINFTTSTSKTFSSEQILEQPAKTSAGTEPDGHTQPAVTSPYRTPATSQRKRKERRRKSRVRSRRASDTSVKSTPDPTQNTEPTSTDASGANPEEEGRVASTTIAKASSDPEGRRRRRRRRRQNNRRKSATKPASFDPNTVEADPRDVPDTPPSREQLELLDTKVVR